MLITISCALIGHIRNNVSDLIGAKTTKGKECCSNVSSRLLGGALRDEKWLRGRLVYGTLCHRINIEHFHIVNQSMQQMFLMMA